MKIEIEITESRYELLKQYSEKIEVTLDSYINFAIYEQLRRNGAFGRKNVKS